MKPAHAILAGLCLSACTGITGYWLGISSRHQSPPEKSAATSHAPRARPAPPPVSPDSSRDLVSRLDRETDPLRRFSIALDHMEDWVASDPASALTWLRNQPLTARRNEVIRLALIQWAAADPASAASWSKQNLQGIEHDNILIRIAEQWVTSDPATATRWFADLPPGRARSAALEGMLFRWASADPASARTFLTRDLPSDAGSPHLLQAIHAGWAKSDPPAAVSSSLATSQQTNNPGLFANTLANWATIDVASSSAWLLQNVPPGPHRTAAIGEIAGMFAQHDPSSGFTWIDKLTPQERPAARDILATTWAETDAPSAAQWLSSQPVDHLSSNATNSILTAFLAHDDNAYTQWLDSLPPGPLKETAIGISELPDE